MVKVLFNLGWLLAEESADKLKSMLTDAGRISQRSRTNRPEGIEYGYKSARHLAHPAGITV